ncbi:Cys-tRNA(Pro) deacylase [Rhodococcus fascians]|uniref:Cys-tRNA(Pro) deacylase n=1 Tax=Nocardiaceae TaxID=85025 RepID=UPI00050C4C73|nr:MULTISPECIES: Cys-tRNA(Pro) deacylase [Rhodococcus]MBY4038084.1 Cys-tRNA(Pro) deacylase [Rhodococcus fascians]MDP9637045.1 Cys-tRNA(Pro)/Cys-tRNA(Cys) deacylase [Rhodococcus cercidiphylli]MBY4139071.1 Cys-tRNA(Pro) deacylase [Rhodococcus fascians]MBY4216687.1 Cys-tRNA(Pro) deacylase [Rhodococcus fascians]MBY4222951.1 Cys-tRNA(Pro) deacylase [Rhodococcus fascians]
MAASTPALALLTARKVAHIVHTYEHDPRTQSFGSEAAEILGERLGVHPEQVFKTLVVERADRSLAVAVVPVTGLLSLKAAAAALDTRKVAMADRAAAERSSGYVFGGISPLGQRRSLPTVIDDSALEFDRVLCSGGRRGLEIELAPADLIRLTRAVTAPIAAH